MNPRSQPIELRDADEARQYLLQSFVLQRIVSPRAEEFALACDWALAVAAEGEPIPPLGFIADVGHSAFRTATHLLADAVALPGWPATLARAYEDAVVTKLLADSLFERAGDALRTYASADHARGLAFVLIQMSRHVALPGVHLSPGVLKALRDSDAAEVLLEAVESFHQIGPMPLLVECYLRIVQAMRAAPELLASEDLFEVERRTAIAAFGQRVALRQVLQAARQLDELLPRQKPRITGDRHDVATHIREDDHYPVGGFSSLSTRGSIESLLHSQLAFMEQEGRPDLFDIKFLRDELLYYARDENTFLRRRRTFVIALWPDLALARRKDHDLPWQRIIVLLAFVCVAIRRTIDWLSSESLTYEILLISPDGVQTLDAERELLEMLLREQIENGTVSIAPMHSAKTASHLALRARRSLCQFVAISMAPRFMEIESVESASLDLSGTTPKLHLGETATATPDAGNALASWASALERLLASWL